MGDFPIIVVGVVHMAQGAGLGRGAHVEEPFSHFCGLRAGKVKDVKETGCLQTFGGRNEQGMRVTKRGHTNFLCTVPILLDDHRREA